MNEAQRRILHEDVIRLLGELDDLVVSQILATGASLAEFEEAVAELEFEVESDDQPVASSSPKVDELRALLRELFADELAVDEDIANDVFAPGD